MLTRKIIFKAGLFHVIYGIILEINTSYDKYTRFSEAETNPQSEGECCSNNNLTVSKKKTGQATCTAAHDSFLLEKNPLLLQEISSWSSHLQKACKIYRGTH